MNENAIITIFVCCFSVVCVCVFFSLWFVYLFFFFSKPTFRYVPIWFHDVLIIHINIINKKRAKKKNSHRQLYENVAKKLARQRKNNEHKAQKSADDASNCVVDERARLSKHVTLFSERFSFALNVHLYSIRTRSR